jgi:hypothetical protein
MVPRQGECRGWNAIPAGGSATLLVCDADLQHIRGYRTHERDLPCRHHPQPGAVYTATMFPLISFHVETSSSGVKERNSRHIGLIRQYIFYNNIFTTK